MDIVEKLRVVIPHWLEHNRQHKGEFERWMEELQAAGRGDLAHGLARVVELITSVDGELEGLLESAGGPLDHPHAHHHHHHGEG